MNKRTLLLTSLSCLALCTSSASAQEQPQNTLPYKVLYEVIEQNSMQNEKILCGIQFVLHTDYEGLEGRLTINRFHRLTIDFAAGSMDEFGVYENTAVASGVISPANSDAVTNQDLKFAFDENNAIQYDQPRNKEWRTEAIKNMVGIGFRLSYYRKDNPATPVNYDFIPGNYDKAAAFENCQASMFKQVTDQYKAKHGNTECLEHPERCTADSPAGSLTTPKTSPADPAKAPGL